ncbi:MAG TPA: 4'-phosphopantetheinyl transferase superfamily protein [Phycisphaerales bacterium]|nr:4'-phosphopantetheinyl transferase superfamily protein [Phycisphaerales bacterium]
MMALGPDEVHLWNVDVSGLVVAEARRDLVHAECNEADAISLQRGRDDFIRQRASLRRLLSTYTGQKPNALKFTRGAAGKPALLDRQPQIEFNLSHSGTHTLIGVSSGRAIGVDVQVVRRGVRCLDLARRFFSHAERAYIESVAPADIDRAFFDLWTLKEAWLKATGAGISGGLDRFSVDTTADPPRLCLGDQPDLPPWVLRRVPIDNETLAAVALQGNAKAVIRVGNWRPAESAPTAAALRRSLA